jgi:hypothetical protein
MRNGEMKRARRSLSVPDGIHASAVRFEHRAPPARHSAPHMRRGDFHPAFQGPPMHNVEEHPWQVLLNSVHLPTEPRKCTHTPHGSMDEETANWWTAESRRINVSVVAVELLMTGVVLSFAIISFWYGTWTILDLAMDAVYGPTLTGRWRGLLTVLAIGLAALVVAVLLSRTRLATFIYRTTRPVTWRELAFRTLADRVCQYVQAWGGICIWKAVWDLWAYFILPDAPWFGALTAHLVGLAMLLATFSFRSAVTPPMIFVEDTIMREQLGSRWNLLSKLLLRVKRRQLNPLASKWESEAAFVS